MTQAERKDLIKTLQLKLALKRLPCLRPNEIEQQFFEASLGSMNSTMSAYNIEIVCKDGGYVLLGRPFELMMKIQSLVVTDHTGYIEAILSRVRSSLCEICPWLPHVVIDKFDFSLTGGDGYDGGLQFQH